MGGVSPFLVVVDDEQRRRPEAVAARTTAPHRQVVRARIVLAAAQGWSNINIAKQLRLHENTVRTWRRRYTQRGIEGLADLPRFGRPPCYRPSARAEVKAMACELPARTGVPLSRWSGRELARQAALRPGCCSPSPATVRRWLAADALRLWRYRSWITRRDPDFAAKAAPVLDLYARLWHGQPLEEGDFVLSADEKTSIQARGRLACTPARPGSRLARVEHEYTRGGALAYLAVWDVHRGQLTGRTEAKNGIASFAALVEQVMTGEPYASAKRVFWIVDNGSAHRGQTSIDRLMARWPNAYLVHLPVHASWLNQIEIYFSIIQRKVLTPNDFPDLAAVEARLCAFEDRYNATAQPFDWKFTRHDLDDLINRLDQVPAAA